MTDDPHGEAVRDAMADLDAIAEILHGLGTASISGEFAIQGCSLKWLGDRITKATDRISAGCERLEKAP